ncbi:DUF397 domain-containing protein [Saccharopolyspora elongata]|uniref:DUF397 domain-containing protein n=1 Tax=Saccharopolyspora elongata TaxID=2530387 RepID=A0A4R4Z7Y3_9PSEU|nr:DUF397 domain-containing protein [Saccharopolyspora elongata]TDD54381.1 DUF397 domain-containing protein [Saccharopolyspora elongata]
MPINNRDTGWFKSRRSTSGNDQCVECRIVSGAGTGVRDSKDRDGGVLWIPPLSWASFSEQAKAGAFDLPN